MAPKKRQRETVQCVYFSWKLGVRKGVYQADGRSNSPSVGRHSLGTRDLTEAKRQLCDLDLTMAVEYGLADASLLRDGASKQLSLSEGREIYERYLKRPAVAGGPKPSTVKRYRPVMKKFQAYCGRHKIQCWNQVNRNVFDGYAAWLDDESYAYATEYLELNTVKQILNHLVSEKHLPASVLFEYPMQQPDGTNTYCYTAEQVRAMLVLCEQPELRWLQYVVLGLARTGMRISELAELRWTDINLDRRMITLTDERRTRRNRDVDRRTVKSGYSRSFPIHSELEVMLKSHPRSADNLVFHGPRAGRIKPDTIRNCLIRDVLKPLAETFPAEYADAGIAAGRLHSFRHFFCSECANAGIPERVVMKWLGHRSSKMIRHYYHLHDDESHRQMQRLQTYGSSSD